MKPRARRGGGRPTIADVARLAGVGAITVSRALREPERVSESLRQQIQQAVDELGYVPDPNARALASARAEVFGVLVPSLTNSVFAEVVRGIYDSLSDSSFRVQLGNTHYSGLEEERLLQVFLSQRPAALIVSGIDQTATARKLLETAGCPVVQIMETGPDPVDMMVGFSHFEGGRAATNHMIEVGYRKIGFLGARMDPRSQRRLAGYRAAMEAAGLFDPRLVTTTPVPSSVTLGRDLFRDALAKMPSLDGVFCNNDDIALGVLFECHRAVDRRAADDRDIRLQRPRHDAGGVSVGDQRQDASLRDRPPGGPHGARSHRRQSPGESGRRSRLRAEAARKHRPSEKLEILPYGMSLYSSWW